MERKHYGAIDGLRTIACIGILMMHVRANTRYAISGLWYDDPFIYQFCIPVYDGICVWNVLWILREDYKQQDIFRGFL